MIHRVRPLTGFWWIHLRSHPADGGNIVAGAQEVPGVLLQLEVAQPLEDGVRILGHRVRKSKPGSDPNPVLI